MWFKRVKSCLEAYGGGIVKKDKRYIMVAKTIYHIHTLMEEDKKAEKQV
jgi:hypothetical protein